jgi:hypothetical protein
MKSFALLLLCVALAACTSAPPPPASAKPCLQYIECPDGLSDCRAQAHDMCPTGYTTVDETALGDGWDAFARAHFPGASTGVPHIIVTCLP